MVVVAIPSYVKHLLFDINESVTQTLPKLKTLREFKIAADANGIPINYELKRRMLLWDF